MKKRQLKNFLIHPKYQFKIVGWMLVTSSLLTLVYGSVFYNYISENYQILVELSPMTEEAKILLFKELDEILIKLTLFSLGFLMIVAALGIVLTHRSAGPLYHFKRVFDQIKSGQTYERIRLRPGDDFQEVAKSFNEMMDEVQISKSA